MPSRRAALPVAAGVLVGRDCAVAEIERLLAAPGARLLTLTGPPGVGKTRLALAAAASLAGRFADGVVFVDLTAVRTPDLVLGEVAHAVGLAETSPVGATDRLSRALAGKELLLVVDNLEHVLDAAADLAAPLAQCPTLRILVTSRERLGVHAEREFPVQPLELPDADADLRRVAATAAVAMLVARVQGFQPDFAVTAENRAALAEICVRLDGLPLALELAAARLRLFTPAELAARLRQRTDLLTGGTRDGPERHRTLRAALTWSHDLLDAPERALFRRLSVFVGGATLDAAQDVCGADPPLDDVVETMASLVDKSLVRRRTRHGDVAEYVMLESLREYAAELLGEHGEGDDVRARHARYCVGLAVATQAGIGTAHEQESVADVGYEQGNLRAALDHCEAAGRTALVLPLATALGWHAYTRGQLGRGLAIVERALAGIETDSEPPAEEALTGMLMIAATVAVGLGEPDRAAVYLARGLEISRRRADLRHTAIGTAFLGHVARAQGRYEEAVVHHEQAGNLHAQLGNAGGVAWSRYDLGLLARRRGDLDTAARCLTESLDRFRDLDYRWAAGCAAAVLAAVQLRRGSAAEAAPLLADALERCEHADDARGVAQCLEVAAALACERDAAAVAARLLGAAAALRDRLAAPPADEERGELHALGQQARRALGPAVADRARRDGRALTRAQAVALARTTAVGAEPSTVAGAGLTPREQQVASLVAAGDTNRRIARTLGISEKTAEVHVHHLIRKLGVRSRTEVATWVVTRGSTAAGS